MPSATNSSGPGKQTKKYYAVPRSPLLEKPAIFSSWARAHVVTTGIKLGGAPCKGFETLAKAQDWMEANGAMDFDMILQPEKVHEGPSTGMTYYAVANGRNPGITEVYEGPGGAQNKVLQFSGNCHNGFPTRRQAERFIEDWEDQMVLVAVQKYRRELREGRRPQLTDGGSWFPSLPPPVEAVKQEQVEDAMDGLSIAE